MSDLTLPTARSERDQLSTRTDVLDKVGALATLPDDMHVLTPMVAKFYGVGIEAIKSLVKDNRHELEDDGYRVVVRSEFERFYGDPANLIAPQARTIALFPRRAVLRVGMLLRDSDIARQVRDYLLDAEHDAQPVEIDLTDPDVALDKIIELASLAKSERAEKIKAQNEAKQLANRIEKDAPLVAKAEAHTGSDSSVHRQEFAREVITWGMRQKNIVIKQADVLRFLGHIGLFIRGERTDTGHATADALKRGLAFTDKGTAKNGHAWATGKLTARGQDYAWKKIVAHVEANGTLELPRELRGGEPA